jgi:hypothetical protein
VRGRLALLACVLLVCTLVRVGRTWVGYLYGSALLSCIRTHLLHKIHVDQLVGVKSI